MPLLADIGGPAVFCNSVPYVQWSDVSSFCRYDDRVSNSLLPLLAVGTISLCLSCAAKVNDDSGTP
jgi:hypothetical protein